MAKRVIIILLILIGTITGYSQFFSYTELKSLKDKSHPEGIIELLQSKNMVLKGKENLATNQNDNRYYYIYSKGEDDNNILCHVTIDKKYDDNIPKTWPGIRLIFRYKSKQSYDYLVDRISKYCKKGIWFVYTDSTMMADGWTSHVILGVNQYFTYYRFWAQEYEGEMIYILDIWYGSWQDSDSEQIK